jgi:hypothetical protein
MFRRIPVAVRAAITRLAVLAVPVSVVTGVAFAAANVRPPKVEFGPNGVTVGEVRPGTRVAWMAMLRDRRGYQTRVRIRRGFGPATPNSAFAIAQEAADTTRGMWVVADVDAGTSVHAASPVMTTSGRPIRVRAGAGAAVVEIDSFAVEVLYVRPRGGAWTYSVLDGGGRDADQRQNGTIVMPLEALAPLKGNPHAPAATAAGDLILIIDPRGVRSASVEVTP